MMAKIKIISDGTLAGTEVRNADTDEKINGVRSLSMAIGVAEDGSKFLYATIKVVNPIVDIQNVDVVIEQE